MAEGTGDSRRAVAVGSTPEFRDRLRRYLSVKRADRLAEAEIEKRLGRSGGFLSKIKNGRRAIRPDEVEAIARAADFPDEWLLELFAAAGWQRLLQPPAPRDRVDAWGALVGQIEADNTLIHRGYVREAAARLRVALAEIAWFESRPPPDYERVRAQATTALGAALAQSGDLSEALSHFNGALELWKRLNHAGGMGACLTMQSLVAQQVNRNTGERAEANLQFLYHQLADGHAQPTLVRAHTARDLAWSRRQTRPEDDYVDRMLDRSLEHLASAQQSSAWEQAMTHLEAARTWIDRHDRRVLARKAHEADRALIAAGEALIRARQALPIDADLLARVKLAWAEAMLCDRAGDLERAQSIARRALAGARAGGATARARDIERYLRQLTQ